MLNIGERLTQLRKQLNLSQDDLAKKIGVSRTIIGNYERNTNTPSIEVLVKIAKTFAVDFLTWVTKNYWHNGFGYIKRNKPELEQTEITIFSVFLILYKAELRNSNFNHDVE